MTPDDVRAAAERLVPFHRRFAPLFGTEPAPDHASTSLQGLMCCPERKRLEPIARCTGTGQVSGLQQFIAVAPGDADDVPAEIPSVFADELAPSAAGAPIGTVGVIDESGSSQKGTKSAGVARRPHGRRGQEDDGQVGVSLIGVAPAGEARLGPGLDLHTSWYEGDEAPRRRAEAPIPDDLPFRTKPPIAGAPVRDVVVMGTVGLDGVTAAEEDGQNGDLLDELEELGQR
jgi:SRSO17 transposase